MSYLRARWQKWRSKLRRQIAVKPSKAGATEYLLSEVELVLACPDHVAVEAAYRLGLAHGAQDVMADRIYATGLRRTNDLRAWHAAVHGTRREKHERRAMVEAAVERHLRSTTKLTAAYSAAASECGVSLSTVERVMRRTRTKKSSVSRPLPED